MYANCPKALNKIYLVSNGFVALNEIMRSVIIRLYGMCMSLFAESY